MTNQLLDWAAFLGALILFALAALAVVVIIAAVAVAVVGAIVRLARSGRTRDRVQIDHERAGLTMPAGLTDETQEKMRAAFDATRTPPTTDAGSLTDEQRRTIRDAFGPGGPGAIDLDKMKSKAVGE